MRIAITGGIGEGKSTVLNVLSGFGFETASADDFARSIFSDPSVNLRLAQLVGVEPPIQPRVLRDSIAAAANLRKAVNGITHPKIVELIRSSNAAFIEVPLLIETCLQGEFDQVWVVTCGVREQRRRLAARYFDAGTVSAMMASQLPTRSKIVFADRVIRTNLPIDHVTRIVSESVSGIRF